MSWLKGPLIGNRVRVYHGLDFNGCDFDGDYLEMKFRSGALMGSNPGTTGEWEKGILLTETLDEGTLSGGEYKGKYASALTIQAATTNEHDGHTNGAALRVDFYRTAGYDHTGGSEDIAARINATNYSALESGGIRALNIVSTNRTGIAAKVQGVLITAHQRNSGGFTTGIYGARIVSKNQSPSVATGYQHALEVADESDGVQPALNSILWIEKQSNSYTAATRAGIEIVNNCNTSYAQVITHAIYLKCGASGSNITNVIGFDSNDGTDGFTKLTGTPSQGGNIIGYMKFYNAADGATLYVPCYSQAPA
jgi:hypothetical protein